VTTSSSSAVEKSSSKEFIIKRVMLFASLLIVFAIFFFTHQRNNEYTRNTLELDGSLTNGNGLFKMNCVGCHGITARGLVGPDLHDVTERLSDSQIITQVTKGLTPPMPSFEIEPQNMADLLTYLHTLN
tara:strand:+ start:578 stop:964 length:387 start_codon:yes stop_codon:yes gene_type:complete